jgi:DNA repair exonuclease SbcCD ATPase subunit
MQLTLVNFRHHRNATFTIPENGIIRIKGHNEAGKSTLLNGVCFALYGKCRKPFSHGTKTCSATLKYPRYGLEITRSKLPSNKLLVTYKGIVYEDDNAQSIINNTLGMTHNEFYASSYFDQRKQSSILSMSPADQLSFIEAIAFENCSAHEEKKKIVKDHLKTLVKEKEALDSQVKLLSSQIDSCEKKITKQQEISEKMFSVRAPKTFVTFCLDKTEPSSEGNTSTTINPSDLKNDITTVTADIQFSRSTLTTKRTDYKNAQKVEAQNRKVQEEIIKLETQIGTITSLIENLGQIKTEDQIKTLMDQLSDKKQLLLHIQELKEINSLQLRLDEESLAYFAEKNKNITDLQKQILNTKEIAKLKSSIDSYEKLKPILDEEELLWKSYNEATESAKNGILHIRDTITTDYELSDLSDISEENIEWKDLHQSIDRIIKDHQDKIDTIETELSNVRYQSWHCPKCQTPLHPQTNETDESVVLHIRTVPKKNGKSKNTKSVTQLTDDLSDAKANIVTLENYIINGLMFHKDLCKPKPKKTKNTSGINSMKEYQSSSLKLQENLTLQESLSKLQDIVKSKKLPPHLQKLKSEIKSKSCGIPKDVKTGEEFLNAIKDEVEKLDKEVEKEWLKRSDHSKHSRDLKSYQSQLNNIKGKSTKVDTRKLQDEITTLEKHIDELNEKLTTLNAQLTLSEDRFAVQHAREELENLSKLKLEVEKNLENMNNRIEGAEGLRNASIEAEFLALERTIGSINEHAKIYLSNLFTLPIVAQFRVKRTTKKGDTSVKPSIEIYVEYKGEIYDDIDEFCGSERQRCDLAFLFGVNDMLGSNIIMLDECFNNLDENNAGITFEYIRDMIECVEDTDRKKQVLIITHRVEDGVFDEIVQL